MKKKYILLFTLVALVLGTVACTREVDDPAYAQDGIVVEMNVDGLTTKAENTIQSGFLYLFNDKSASPFKTVPFSGGTTSLGFEEIFNSDENLVKSTTVFAVAGHTKEESVTSLDDLKSRTIDATSFLDGNAVKDDPLFVMTAEGKFEAEDDTHTICKLTLKRLAAKVTLEVDYVSSIETTGKWEFKTGDKHDSKTIWKPMTSGENRRVYLQNAVSNAAIGAAPADPADPVVYPSSGYSKFKYDYVYMGGSADSSPFYTYPVAWSQGDDDAPFIKLIQPWRYTTTVEVGGKYVVVDENVVELYYKVMFPSSVESLDANTWYKTKVTLDILGGEANRPAVITAGGLTVMNWVEVGSDMSDVSVEPLAYLIPESTEYTVTNGAPLVITYYSSGEVDFDPATDVVIYKDVYTNDREVRKYIYYNGGTEVAVDDASTTGIDERYPNPDIKDKYGYKHDGTGVYDDGNYAVSPWFTHTYDSNSKTGKLTLVHELTSDFKYANFAARPYVYTLNLRLQDDPSVTKTITIIQQPPVLAIGDLSTGWVCIDNQTAYEGTKSSDAQAITIFRARQSKDDRSDRPIWDYSKALYNFGTDANHANNSQGYGGGTQFNAYVHAASNRGNDYYMGNVRTYIYLDPDTNNSSRYRVRISVAPNSKLFVCDPREKLSSESGLWHLFTKYYKRSGTSYVETDGLILTGDNTSTASKLTSVDSPYRPAERKDASGYTSATFRPEIAPEFMVASSYGRSTGTKYENAVMRCAAYQEDGYPAGRWRLPTEAEIDYCITLSDMGAIPDLFYPYNSTGTVDYGYRASSGRRKSGNSGWLGEGESSPGNDEGVAFVRCVYDTWYWGHEEDNDLKNGTYTEDGKDYQKYKWGGYKTSK